MRSDTPSTIKPLINGFTLVEAMVVLGIAVILAVAVSPMLTQMPANARLQERTQKIIAHFNNTRGDAIRSNRTIYICSAKLKSNLQIQGCRKDLSSPDYLWDNGLLSYADNFTFSTNHIAQYDSGEATGSSLLDGKVSIISSQNQYALAPTGRLANGQDISFKLVDNATDSCRTVIINSSGRGEVCKKGDSCDLC